MTLSFDEFLRRIPKLDLHYHLLGGVRLETMLAIAARHDETLTLEEAESYYRAHQRPDGPRRGGIAALERLYALMREPDDYYRVLMEVAEDAADSGVRYVELMWNPSDTIPNYARVNAALERAIDDAERRWGIVARLIPSINREKSPEAAVAMVETVAAHPHPYVLGIGIDYREDHAPIERFWKAYRLAGEHGYRLTGHCSEFGLHWRNVETGLDLIGLERIDHGYTVIANDQLAQRCANERIPFTVIPSNTYYRGLWPDREEWREKHPIRVMARLGLTLVPCTDDWHIHDTDGVKLYRTLIEEFGFDLEGIRHCLINAIEACWAPEPLKRRWREQWPAEFDTLRNRLEEAPPIPAHRRIAYRPR